MHEMELYQIAYMSHILNLGLSVLRLHSDVTFLIIYIFFLCYNVKVTRNNLIVISLIFYVLPYKPAQKSPTIYLISQRFFVFLKEYVRAVTQPTERMTLILV